MTAPRRLLAEPTSLPWCCAALSLGASNGGLWNESPPRVLPELAGRLSHLEGLCSPGPIERAAFAAWLDAAVGDHARPGRRRAALAAARSCAGKAPTNLDRLPEQPRFAGRSFARPADWVTAEWHSEIGYLVTALVDSWEDATDSALSGHEPASVWMVVGVCARSSGCYLDMATARAVWSAYPHLALSLPAAKALAANSGSFNRYSPPPVEVAYVPTPVATWLSQVLFSGHASLLPHTPPGAAPDTVELALGLWDPAEGTAALAGCFARAEALLRPR